MKVVSLKEFTETGSFGGITMGSSKGDLIKHFGEKFDFGDCCKTQIIKYGWYEFFYWTETEKIFGIQNDHLQVNKFNHKVAIDFKNKIWAIDKWFLKENEDITFKQVLDLLKKDSIPYKIEAAFEGCDEVIIKCEKSMVTFDFNSEHHLIIKNKKGKTQDYETLIEIDQDNFVLSGIRLFDLSNYKQSN
jgi:hypothetical protein